MQIKYRQISGVLGQRGVSVAVLVEEESRLGQERVSEVMSVQGATPSQEIVVNTYVLQVSL